jgi:TPR repeat protein
MYAHIPPIEYSLAMQWYRRAAQQDDVTAQNNIAFLYENGLGVGKDYKEAFRWYSLSADQGYSRAKYHLGDFYDRGLTVTRDTTRARQLMKEAAAAGDTDAQRWLATH